jgi:hemoglobin/transferrin/lactoferrin receptor protein
MVGDSRRVRARLVVSFAALMIAGTHSVASAQTPAQEQPLPPLRVDAPVQKRTAAKPKPGAHPRSVARRRTAPVTPPAAAQLAREPTTDVATKTQEPVINTLAAVSALRQDQITQAQPSRLSDIFNGMPGVWFSERGDDPAAAINIRGLQDFGRVAVLIDGARQDFQRSGHFANGQFYVDPELLGGVDVVRGPVANVYGSGAIGGVASFRTKDLSDIILPGEMAAVQSHGMFGTNGSQWLGSTFMGARGPAGDVFAGGVYRNSQDYVEGNGEVVPNTGSQLESGLVKIATRPAEGQEIKLSAITYNTNYDFGQTSGSEGVYATNVQNQTVTGQYTLKSPETPLVDFHTDSYWNQTFARQTVKTPFIVGCGPGCNIDFTGPVGTTSSFMLNTGGFDAFNTSRFDAGPFRNTVTYGGDFVSDTVNVADGADPGAALTPGGSREAYGGFVEWRADYSTWFQMINAVRFDGYNLNGDGSAQSGTHVSPKTTVGITPVPGLTPYVTYAEGYRPPSVTEAFVAGFHPGGFFYLTPNPNLQPEVGHNTELGLNVKYDNVFTADDKIRAKVNVFNNDVTNYIDLQQVFTPASAGAPPSSCLPTPFGYSDCFQYINDGKARIQGAEIEFNYDAGLWFGGVSGQIIRGKNLDNGQPLATIPPDQVSFLLGARSHDRKWTVAMRWTAVAAKPLNQIPLEVGDSGPVPVFDPTPAYNLVNLYLGYQPIPNVLAAVSVENLLNVDYTKYMCCSTAAGYVVPSPGITFKGSLTIRYGVKGDS